MFQHFFRSANLIAILTSLLVFPVMGNTTVPSAPDILHYQAHLTNSDGLNVNGDAQVEVWIYDSPTAGIHGDFDSANLIYAESQNVRVDRGVLRLAIGEGTGMGRFNGAPLPMERLAQVGDLYLEVYINSERIEPRQHVGYQNYALLTQYARTADNLSGSLSIPASSLPDMPATKTYGALSPARIPFMDASRISGVFASADRIPANLPLNKLASGTMSEGVIGQIDSTSITADKFSSGVLPPLMYSQAFYVEAGNASNWGAIPLPADFAYYQCKMVAGLKDLTMPTDKMADDLYI